MELSKRELRNGFISVTYANKLSNATVSISKTVEIEDKGGALTSLYANLVIGQ